VARHGRGEGQGRRDRGGVRIVGLGAGDRRRREDDASAGRGETRQVAVAPQPVVADASAGKTWPVILRGNQNVDILGITDDAAPQRQWWQLNGEAIPPPAGVPNSVTSRNNVTAAPSASCCATPRFPRPTRGPSFSARTSPDG
jgi:hypothetical protein